MSQKFYQKASVQVAIVMTIGSIFVASMYIIHQRSQLVGENNRLKREAQKQISEIQKLETLLTPFRTLALEKYTGTDTEVLRKFAADISQLEQSLNRLSAPKVIQEFIGDGSKNDIKLKQAAYNESVELYANVEPRSLPYKFLQDAQYTLVLNKDKYVTHLKPTTSWDANVHFRIEYRPAAAKILPSTN